MASAFTLQTIGKWDSKVGVPLKNVMHVSMDVFGRTGEQACAHGLIMMASSASAITPEGKRRRKVMRDKNIKGENRYLEIYKRRKNKPSRLYKFQLERRASQMRGLAKSGRSRSAAGAHRAADRSDAEWERRKKITNWGLAKRSWMWGLKKLKRSSRGGAGREMGRSDKFKKGDPRNPGQVTQISRISIGGKNGGGYRLTNRIEYLPGIMPGGWRSIVELKASNKIMAQARDRIARDIKRKSASGTRRSSKAISSHFKKV